MFGFGKKKSGSGLIDAMCAGDAPTVARMLPAQDFYMIKDAEGAGGGGSSPFMLEVDGFPAVAAFTSDEHVASFGNDFPDALNSSGTLDAFVVGGGDILKYLPAGVGVIVNAGAKECAVLAPPLVDEVKRHLPS